jgi:hypothetical protein
MEEVKVELTEDEIKELDIDNNEEFNSMGRGDVENGNNE